MKAFTNPSRSATRKSQPALAYGIPVAQAAMATATVVHSQRMMKGFMGN
jgi:hypothetical protein